MIYPYNQVKEHMYNAFGDVFVNPIAALLVASVWGTVLTLPLDNIRTRLMNQFPDKKLNRMNYTGIVNVINKAIQVEGANALFVGMVPHYAHVLLYSALVIKFPIFFNFFEEILNYLLTPLDPLRLRHDRHCQQKSCWTSRTSDLTHFCTKKLKITKELETK